MKHLAWFTFVSLATVTGVALLWQLRGIVILFLLSLVMAAATRTWTDRLVGRGFSVTASILITYLIGLGLPGVLLYAVSGTLLAEFEQMSNSLVSGYDQMVMSWSRGGPFQQAVAGQLPPPNQLYEAIVGEQGRALAGGLFGVTRGFFGVIGQVFAILLLSIYWSAERVRFERLWLSLLSPEGRNRAIEIWRSIEVGLGAYVRSELLQSLLAAISLGIGYWLIGLKYPMTLALAGALAWLIPWLGVLIAVAPVLWVGLMSSLSTAILAGLYTLAVLIFLEVVVERRFFVRRGYSSLLLMLVVLILTDLYGLVGLVFAPLLAATIQIFALNVLRTHAAGEALDPVRRIAELQERLAAVREMLNVVQEPPPPELVSLVDRSTQLVEETQQALQTPSAYSASASLGAHL